MPMIFLHKNVYIYIYIYINGMYGDCIKVICCYLTDMYV